MQPYCPRNAEPVLYASPHSGPWPIPSLFMSLLLIETYSLLLIPIAVFKNVVFVISKLIAVCL